MARKVYDTDGLDMRNTPWDGNETTGNLPVSGRLVEQYVKSLDDRTETTTEVVSGEEKPVQAGAVADAVTGMVTGIDVADSEDGTQYVMSFKARKGDGTDEDREVRFSKYTDDDKVAVSIDLTDSSGSPLPATQFLPLGSGLTARYSVTVGTVGGSAVDGYTGLQARVIMKRGNTVLSAFQGAEFVNVTAGQSYTFDASPYLTDASAYTVQVEARCTYEGQTLQKTATARVTMVAMTLTSTFSVSNGLAGGGYANDVAVPFTLTGTTGEKSLCYRLNGGSEFAVPMSTGSGTQSRNVTLGIADMTEGRNVLEVFARHEPSGVTSDVFYITLLKAGGSVTDYTGIMFRHKAEGFQADCLNPVMRAEQFTAWSFDYAAYDAQAVQAVVKVTSGEETVKEDSLLRTERGSYGKTNVITEDLKYAVTCGTSSISLTVQTKAHADIEATLAGDAVCTFEAYGRSNTESDAATWKSGGLEMKFEDVLWQVNEIGAGSGWHGDRLLLSNGARMTLTREGGHYYPFNEADKPVGQAIADVGMTLEIEFSTANVTDTGAELITCLGTLPNGNRYGLLVTPEEVKFLTGVTTTATDAGETFTYEDSVGTKFEPGTNVKVAYTFYPNVSTNEQRTLIGFYEDGVESAASRWTGKVNFDIEQELTFNSVGADLLIKNVRIYNKALTDDEAMDNYIVDRNHLEDTPGEPGVRSLDEDNRVLDESGKVSLQKLLAMMPRRKNSALIFIGSGSVESEVPSSSDTMNVLDALAQLNDKKANKLVRKIAFYNGEHPEMSFIAENVFTRIQGTSSVNYSRKNWRIYFQKTASGYAATLSYGEIDGNGVQQNPITTEGKQNLFRLRPNSVGVKLACPKCDFSDSSMTTNTGGARFFTDGMKEMGLLTPAQRYAADHGLTEDYRVSIDGLPCDLFAAMSEDEDLTYYGQYNMNNDKSESYPIFGQDASIGTETWGEGDTLDYLMPGEDGVKRYLPIAIETLNNSNPCCLFQWVPGTDSRHAAFMDRHFDGGLELNHPKDTFWNSGKGDASGEPNMKEHLGSGDKYDRMYKAIDRLMSFISRCTKETQAGSGMRYDTESGAFTGMDYADDGSKFPTAKWQSATFRAHASEYIDVPYSLAYHMFVDVNLGVDQLAKNIIWRTWDGVIWYPNWYDGDCQHGNDNKSMLTGRYDDNRQTKRDGAYVMQGHDSWLWNLLLANFADMRETLMASGVDGGASFRSAFSVQKAMDYFNTGQMDRWCGRLYNKSGIFKYIYPFLNALPVGGTGTMQTYPQIYGMKGNLKAHRNYFIRRRYDLKQVEYGYMSTNGAQLYQSTSSQNAGRVLQPMDYVLSIPYRVQISTSNGVQADSGVVDAGVSHTLALQAAFNENDPLKIVGAEKIRELTWHEDAFALGFNFGLFTGLVRLDMSVTAASGYRNASFMAGTESMTLLEELVMAGNWMARNGDNGNQASLDLRHQGRLKRALLAGTGLERVTFATGCPLAELELPGTLTELFLEYLPKLTDTGLTLESIDSITGYRHSDTPGIDGLAFLERLHQAKVSGTGRLERFSIQVDTEDDSSMLDRYRDYKTYTSSGANDNVHSGLRGTVRLTRYVEDSLYDDYRRIYPELNIIQPEYTMIEFDDSVADDANVSNLDNKTGYKYGTQYVPSGHIKNIFSRRHRVLAKVTRMPTSRMDAIAGNTGILVNNPDGEMTYCPLDDGNSNLYYDGSLAKLDGTEGDWMMFEPFFWSKGINDYLNLKHYSCYSKNDSGHMPSVPAATVLTYEDIGAAYNGVQPGKTIVTGKDTLHASYGMNSNYSVCRVEVAGYRRVRFPSVIGTNLIGAVFVDENLKVVGSVVVEANGHRFEDGMYLISDVPEGARELYFTILKNAEFDKVVLSKSNKIEYMEPDWVPNYEHLCAVVGSSLVDDKFRACITGKSCTGGKSWNEFHVLSQQRGMQQMDALMHFRIANLFYAMYGRLDSQMQCGAGLDSYSRIVGGTASHGMQDTVNTNGIIIGGYGSNGIAFYEERSGIFSRVYNTCCIGYEDIYGNKSEMMDCVDMPNNIGVGKMRIWMPDGSTRLVKVRTTNDVYITAVAHGKYMDVVPVGIVNGSLSTYYCDTYWYANNSVSIAFCGYHDSESKGGISAIDFGVTNNYANGVIGSRLAFRGKLVRAENVETFKEIEMLA